MSKRKGFLGYHRPDGQVGVRNHVLILPVSRSANILAEKISKNVHGTKALITLGEGGRTGYDRKTMRRVLSGLALNANTASVLLLGTALNAGYPELKCVDLFEEIESSGKQVELLLTADDGGFYKTLGKGILLAREMVWDASRLRREPAEMGKIKLAVKCGLSDASSGMAGNPAVGRIFDMLIESGSFCFFSETTEIIGAEHILAERCKNENVRKKLFAAVKKTEEDALSTGEDIRKTNPIPENIAGGLSTLEEKSLGAIVKSGTKTIEDVIEYAQRPERGGLYFKDAWMSSYSLPLGYAASGATLFIYQVGGGGVAGKYPPPMATSTGVVTPILYATANRDSLERSPDTFDVSSVPLLEGSEELPETSERMLDTLLDIASGTLSRSETLNYEDPVEVLFRGPFF